MKRIMNNNILIFGDLHAPYQHKDTLEFLSLLNESFNLDRIICTGDMLDQYPLSRFPKSPSAENVIVELKKAKKVVAKLAELFPRMDIVKSNHCERLYQKAAVGGIPREFLIPYMELIGAPEGWNMYDDLSITIDATRQQLYVAHTKTGTPKQCAGRLASNVAFGHNHNKLGIEYISNPKQSFFGADVGCLISDKGYPFGYNKGTLIRPTRGVLIVAEGMPLSIHMDTFMKLYRKSLKQERLEV